MNSEIITHSNIRFLLVTANTGTVFEKPELLTAWINEFTDLVRRHPSDFIALHCQEVGGKDYERFMHILDPFIKDLLQIAEIVNDFTHYRLYFDSDYTSQDTFTALGSSYFIRRSIPIQQWNFTTALYENVVDRQIFTGNLINAQTLRKEKFPREFFPEAKWSRKGFTQTRWSINSFIFDMVNVHLFHDASNLLAVEQSPSVYSQFRKNALEYTLRSLPLNTSDALVPYAIFGDFNFRLDAHRLLQHIAEARHGSIDKIKQGNSDEILKIVIKTDENKTYLTIEKKEFNLHDGHDEFFSTDHRQFHMFDLESESFIDHVFEYEKTFPPSYPYSEEHDEARSYLRARCPAWCDRILLSNSFKNFILTQNHQPSYNIIGEDVCMGDHKPVYLSLTIDLIEDRFTSSNLNLYDTSNQNNNHARKSPVTVMRENELNLILNEIPLTSTDLQLFNVHDYAIFIQSNLLPCWWFGKLQQRPLKAIHTLSSSSKLWAKVRAVTYMTTLGHRTGSWYSDDQTENSPTNDLSTFESDSDEKTDRSKIQFYDVDTPTKAMELAVPLRRSFSSADCTRHSETSPPSIPLPRLSRSHSTTAINSSDHLSDSSPVDLPLSLPPPLPQPLPPSPSPPPPAKSSSRVYRFLYCIIL